MKKISMIMLLFAFVFLLAACEREKIITMEELPVTAQTYVQTTYPGVNVMYVKQENELFSTKYKVLLENRLELEFDSDGVPKDIDTDD